MSEFECAASGGDSERPSGVSQHLSYPRTKFPRKTRSFTRTSTESTPPRRGNSLAPPPRVADEQTQGRQHSDRCGPAVYPLPSSSSLLLRCHWLGRSNNYTSTPTWRQRPTAPPRLALRQVSPAPLPSLRLSCLDPPQHVRTGLSPSVRRSG